MTIANLRAEVQEVQDQLCFVRDMLCILRTDAEYNTEVMGYCEAYVYATTLIQEFINQAYVSTFFLNMIPLELMQIMLTGKYNIEAQHIIIGKARTEGQNFAFDHIIKLLMPIIAKFTKLEDEADADDHFATNARKSVKSPKKVAGKPNRRNG